MKKIIALLPRACLLLSLICGVTAVRAADAADANKMTSIMAIINLILDDDDNTPVNPTPPQPPAPSTPPAAYDGPVAIGNIAQLNNADAGALPGSMGVGNGAATYSLPIALPPGVAGVQPSLSLNYSGTNSSGVAGLGWSVGGTSAIDRCGRNFAVNNTTDVARFLPADRLCLDGQQLILINGDHNNDAQYWSDGAEYRTEIEGFSRIRAVVVNGLRGFTVETKAGQTLTYGYRADAYLTGQGRTDGLAHRWWLSSSTDRSGNTIDYLYSVNGSTGESRLNMVRWGGNLHSGQHMFVKAELVYEDRPDAHVTYVAGSHFDERLRLKSIITSTDTQADGSGGTVALRYSLTYETSASSGRSLLKSVQACDAGSACLPATTFDWGKKNPDVPRAFVSMGGVRQGPNLQVLVGNAAWYPKSLHSMLVFGDFNGDGKTDILERRKLAANGYQQHLYLSNGDGNGWTVSTPLAGIAGEVVETGDFDGDGQLDLLIADLPGGTAQTSNWRICRSRLNTGGGFSCDMQVALPVEPFKGSAQMGQITLVRDFDGDGRDDLMLSGGTLPTDKQYSCLSTGTAFNCQTGMAMFADLISPDLLDKGTLIAHPNADMDGDGRSDQVMLGGCKPTGIIKPKPTWECSDKGPIYVYTRGSVNSYHYWSYWFAFANQQTSVLGPVTSGALTSDLNADGLTDMVFGTAVFNGAKEITSANAHVCYSNGSGDGGNGADCFPLPASGNGFDHEVMTLGDFDGDGVPDVLRPSHDTWDTTNITGYRLCHVGPDARSHTCEAWQGPTFYSHSGKYKAILQSDGSYYVEVESQFLGDFNGDGKQDIVTYLGGSNWEIHGAADQAMPGQAIDRLLSVTNGLGAVEKVEYATVNDSTVYRDVAYDINGQPMMPAYPVKRAPVMRQLVKSFSRSNGQGGWLTSRYSYAGNANDGAGRGNLGFARQDVTNAQTGHVTTTWFRQDFPYIGMVSASLTNRYAETMPVSGNGVLNKIVNTLAQGEISQPNGRVTRFPNIQTATVTRRDLDGSDLGTTTTTNDYGAYGNLRTSSVSAWVAGGDGFTAVTAYLYDSNEASWRLADLKSTSQTNAAPGSVPPARTVDYTYDAQGLVATETQQAADPTLKLVTTYDRSGNLSGLVNKVTQQWIDPASGAQQSRVVSEVEHDAKGRFPVWKKNALGQLESYPEYDAASGVLTRRIDINGLTFTQTVDGFGRKRSETTPDGNQTHIYEKACDASCPLGAVAISITDYIKAGQRSALPKLVYSDSAGHVLRTQSWAFDGSVIVADTSYDERGRVAQTYQPRVVGAPAILASRQAYDDLDRVTSTVTLSDAGAEINSSTQYQGLTTVLTNARGHSKTEKRDVRGKLASSLDAGGGTTYYQHDAFGNLMRTQDPAGNVVTVGYDNLGRRVWLNDPDLGIIVYSVDPLGQVWLQTSPLQRAASTGSQMWYDALGRMIKRSEPDLTSYWNYDVIPGQSDCQALKSCAQLVQAYTQDASGKVDYLRQARFDALGRPSSGEIRLDTVYSNSITYDALGRPQTQSYQRQGGAVKQYTQRYNARGYLERIERGALVLWRATAQDASARVTNAALGNGLNVARTYNPYTGHLSFGSLGNAQAQNQLSESYNYDALGNVKQRAQYWPGQGFTEDFEYDGLNRLTVAVVAGQFGQYFHYDAVGNMLSKTGVGSGNYVYPAPGSARPHAVSSIPGIGDFQYDANGNLLSGAGRTVSWTSFDMPRSISKGNESSTFMYGPDHQRARQERSDGTSTYYAGPMEVEINNGATRVKTYWPMGLGVEIDQPTGATELNWTHLDRLGSVVAISDAVGALKEKLAYDSWGKRRTLDGGATPDELDGVTDNRGYTGHEMLEKLDLVHMNGRVYDPLVARFMSADPIIQDPEHSQSYNRYTYVWNNPTNLTDPTGFLAMQQNSNDGEGSQECTKKNGCIKEDVSPTNGELKSNEVNNKNTSTNDPSSSKGVKDKPAGKIDSKNNVPKTSIDYRKLAEEAYKAGDMHEAFQYRLKVLEVQNSGAARAMQVADPSMSDEGAILLGAMVGNPQGTAPSVGSSGASSRRNGGITNAIKLDPVTFATGQLDKKFKHASDFGLSTTKKNPETLKQYQNALQVHVDSPGTYQHGTYQYVPGSTVRFNFTTKNVVVVGKDGNFVTGWKLAPDTPQYDNYLRNGVLR